MEGDAVAVPVDCVGRDKVVQAFKAVKTGIADGRSIVQLELIASKHGIV